MKAFLLARGVTIVVALVTSTALGGCEGRRHTGAAGAGSGVERSGPSIAIVDLTEGVPEQSSSGWLGLSARATTLQDLAEYVEGLHRDKDLRGILVRLGTARIGLARAREVGAMLAAIDPKLPVWCHADDYDNATLYVASLGCRRVWTPPAGGVDAVGLAAQTLYFHKLLADELGLDVDFLQVGKFKGAEEPFTRDGPSPEARASLEATLSDLRLRWLAGIRAGRPSAGESVPEDGPYSAEQSKTLGLVDDVGYFDEARDALERATGAIRSEIQLGPGAVGGGGGDLADAVRIVIGESFGSAPVMLVRATGAITLEGGGISGDSGGIVERKLARLLSRLENDDEVKAVVLRIDSPGGSALASDLLWHQLMALRARKPLVVSVGDMAASGGYYMASTGAAIFADETSIVGSIGVVGGKIAANRALEKIGIHAQTFPAKAGDARAEARAAYESLLLPWDDATRERVLETMEGVYQLFLTRVSEGRGIPVERVAASAEGRIFSGHDARERGLVDVIGGLREAVERAKTMAGLPPDAGVGIAGESTGWIQALVDDDGSQSRTPWSELKLPEAAAEAMPFLTSVLPLAKREDVLCALPFALTVR
jgi:protease-4